MPLFNSVPSPILIASRYALVSASRILLRHPLSGAMAIVAENVAPCTEVQAVNQENERLATELQQG